MDPEMGSKWGRIWVHFGVHLHSWSVGDPKLAVPTVASLGPFGPYGPSGPSTHITCLAGLGALLRPFDCGEVPPRPEVRSGSNWTPKWGPNGVEFGSILGSDPAKITVGDPKLAVPAVASLGPFGPYRPSGPSTHIACRARPGPLLRPFDLRVLPPRPEVRDGSNWTPKWGPNGVEFGSILGSICTPGVSETPNWRFR